MLKKDNTGFPPATSTSLSIYHDDVLRAVTSIARTLINVGVPVNVARAIAVSLAKVIQADAELTVEDVNEGIAESFIESPPGEYDEEEDSQELESEKTVSESSKQAYPRDKHGNSDNEESLTAGMLPEGEAGRGANLSSTRDRNNKGDSDAAEHLTAEFKGSEEPASGLFSSDTLVQSDTEKQNQIIGVESPEKQGAANDGVLAGIWRRISGDPSDQQNDSLQDAGETHHQVEDLSEQTSSRPEHDIQEVEENHTAGELSEKDRDEKPAFARTDTEINDGVDSETAKQLGSNVEGEEEATTVEYIDSSSMAQPDTKRRIHVAGEDERPSSTDEGDEISQTPDDEFAVSDVDGQIYIQAEHDNPDAEESLTAGDLLEEGQDEMSASALITGEESSETAEQRGSNVEGGEELIVDAEFDFASLIQFDTEKEGHAGGEKEQPEEATLDLIMEDKNTPGPQITKQRDQTCSVCNNFVRPGKKFCTHCGAVRCDNCKTFVKRETECSNCHALL